MRIIALLALCIAAVAAVPANPERIVGGSTTTIQAYPSMVSLLLSQSGSNFRHVCGGTIINNRSILTTTNCVQGNAFTWFRARVGSTYNDVGGTVLSFTRYITHPNFDRWTNDNDIAVMRTTSTFTFGDNIRAAPIAGSNYNLGDNEVVWTAGWGYTSPTTNSPSVRLRHVQIWTINHTTCVNNYGERDFTVTPNMLCAGYPGAGGRDQCFGDAGGPLFHRGTVVALGSWGVGCGTPNFPGVYTTVSRYTSWIQNNA